MNQCLKDEVRVTGLLLRRFAIYRRRSKPVDYSADQRLARRGCGFAEVSGFRTSVGARLTTVASESLFIATFLNSRRNDMERVGENYWEIGRNERCAPLNGNSHGKISHSVEFETLGRICINTFHARSQRRRVEGAAPPLTTGEL